MSKNRVWLSMLGVTLVLTCATGWSPDAGLHLTAASTMTPIATPTASADEISAASSPDGRWTAAVNRTAGSLEMQRTQDGHRTTVFPAGSTIGSVLWSPDSRRLAIVRNNWVYKSPAGTGVKVGSPIEIWQVTIEDGELQPATCLFQSQAAATAAAGGDGAEQIVLGDWSPNARYLFFWVGPLSVSVQADGPTPYIVDADTGQSTQVASAALINRRYHSWAPDSRALALTAGDYRSAQINKWLVLFNTTTARPTTIISNSEQIPGIVTWSPRGDVIAYAAVSAVQTNEQLADLMTWDNPAIAGRRIYLLDPDTGKQGRLNTTESFQDAPLWSADGLTLYYVERQGDQLVVMAADPATGQAKPVEGAREPLPEIVGYYGQSDLNGLLARRPDSRATSTPTPISATDQEVLRLIFKKHASEMGDEAQLLLQQVVDGQYTDFSREDVDLNGDGQPDILVSGRSSEAHYLFVAILARDASEGLHELSYTSSSDGKYSAQVRAKVEEQPGATGRSRLRVVADFLTSGGGSGEVTITWEQRWIECQESAATCALVWSAPLLQASRSVTTAIERSYALGQVQQPDGQTVHLTVHRFGISLPRAESEEEKLTASARRFAGPDSVDIYRWDGQSYRLESRSQLSPGLEISREFDLQTKETSDLIFSVAGKPFWSCDDRGCHFDSDGYQKVHADMWGLPAPGQPDDPRWGSVLRQPDVAAHTVANDRSELWVAGIIGALDRPACRLSVHRQAGNALNLVGRVDVPCTPAFTHLTWADVTGDGADDLLLLTIAPEMNALGQLQRLHLFTVKDNQLTEVATLDGYINGADGTGIRCENTPGGLQIQAGLPVVDADASPSPTLADIHLERAFKTHGWDAASNSFRARQ